VPQDSDIRTRRKTINKLIETRLCALPLLALVPVAFAGPADDGPTARIPEPGVLELAAIGRRKV